MSRSFDSAEAADSVLLTRYERGLSLVLFFVHGFTPRPVELDSETGDEIRLQFDLSGDIVESAPADPDRFDDFRVAADQLEELGWDGPVIALLRAAERIRP